MEDHGEALSNQDGIYVNAAMLSMLFFTKKKKNKAFISKSKKGKADPDMETPHKDNNPQKHGQKGCDKILFFLAFCQFVSTLNTSLSAEMTEQIKLPSFQF